MSDRGIKKWNAYKALPEHEETIKKFINERNKKEKPTLSEEEAQIINDYLTNYHGQKSQITYFKNGEFVHVESVIKRIDVIDKKIILPTRKTINLTDLISIKDIN